MLYVMSVTIPANTPIATPYSATLKLSPGMLKRVAVHWWWGCGNLCGVRLLFNEFQLYPLTPSQWVLSFEGVTTWEEQLDIGKDPCLMKIEGYNLDDSFPHTVWVAALVIREDETPQLQELIDLLKYGVGYG